MTVHSLKEAKESIDPNTLPNAKAPVATTQVKLADFVEMGWNCAGCGIGCKTVLPKHIGRLARKNIARIQCARCGQRAVLIDGKIHKASTLPTKAEIRRYEALSGG